MSEALVISYPPFTHSVTYSLVSAPQCKVTELKEIHTSLYLTSFSCHKSSKFPAHFVTKRFDLVFVDTLKNDLDRRDDWDSLTYWHIWEICPTHRRRRKYPKCHFERKSRIIIWDWNTVNQSSFLQQLFALEAAYVWCLISPVLCVSPMLMLTWSCIFCHHDKSEWSWDATHPATGDFSCHCVTSTSHPYHVRHCVVNSVINPSVASLRQ